MKFQLVRYRCEENSEPRLGIAKIAEDDGYNGGSVDWIVDCETGVKMSSCWTFDWTALPFDKMMTEAA